MNKSRNKNLSSNSESDNDIDMNNNTGQFQKNNESDEDFFDNSDFSDEIEKKIDSIWERNKNLKSGKNENNFLNQGINDEKKKKEKYDKKIMKNYFNDYFDASHNKIEDYYEVNYPELNKYELKIDLYSYFYKLIENKKIFPSLEKKIKKPIDIKREEDEDDKDKDKDKDEINDISMGNLFSLMYELLYKDFNVFLYGFGNKMYIIYEFIKYYQMKYNDDINSPLYIISCNLNNSEMSMKVIINKIENCLMLEFEKYFGEGNNDRKFSMESTIQGQILKIKKIYNEIVKSLNKKIDNEDEKDSSLDEDDDNDIDNDNDNDDDEENKIKIKKEKDIKNKVEKNKISKNSEIDGTPFKILLIIHNIGSNIGQSKFFQENLSELANKLNFVNLVVTCENLTIPYYWTSEVKDKFRFCFLKFNTHEPYDVEIDENNSIKGGNNIRSGDGLKEIFSSFSLPQKKLIKEIAKLHLKNEYDKLTQKGLIKHFVDSGQGIVTDIQKLNSLIFEAIDHEIVSLKLSSVNNKEIYKMNLDRNIIEKIAEGEYM